MLEPAYTHVSKVIIFLSLILQSAFCFLLFISLLLILFFVFYCLRKVDQFRKKQEIIVNKTNIDKTVAKMKKGKK